MTKANLNSHDSEQTFSTDQPKKYTVGMTEEESYQIYEAFSMIRVLEDMALEESESDVTISRQSLAVTLAVIRKKLDFTERFFSEESPQLPK